MPCLLSLHPLRLRYFGFVLFAGLALAGCKKETPAPEATAQALLLGRWELTDYSGGLAGGTHPADPAQRREIIFTATGQVTALLNGATTGTAPYTLSRADAITGRQELFLTTTGATLFATGFILVTASDLFVSDNMYDGFTRHYVRR